MKCQLDSVMKGGYQFKWPIGCFSRSRNENISIFIFIKHKIYIKQIMLEHVMASRHMNVDGIPMETTGARCVRKKKKINKILYNTTRGRTHLLPFFLSRRVKLIVTSECLNIFKKCFHQSKVK
jgi:hypothetical protein